MLVDFIQNSCLLTAAGILASFIRRPGGFYCHCNVTFDLRDEDDGGTEFWFQSILNKLVVLFEVSILQKK